MKYESVTDKILHLYGIKRVKECYIMTEYYYLQNIKENIIVKDLDENVDLTESIKVQKYTDDFNIPLENFDINNSVRAIIFGQSFNHSLDNLPSHIELIIFPFNSNFSMSVDNLPIGCKYLLFGQYFQHSLQLLPTSVIFVEYALFSECYKYIYDKNKI
jgi:hypothetical protein